MREVERSAPSVEEALEAALEELGVSEQEAEVQIVQEPERGFLGLRQQEAVVRVRVRNEAPSDDELEDQAEVAEDFLEELLERMGLDAELDHDVVDGIMYVDILAGDDPDAMGLLIGRHGQTLDALQEIVRGAVQRKLGGPSRIVVDIEDYRKRRRKQLVSRASEIARRVKRTGKDEELEPMSAFERKIVHDAVSTLGGVETVSEGEDPHRYVVIRRRG